MTAGGGCPARESAWGTAAPGCLRVSLPGPESVPRPETCPRRTVILCNADGWRFACGNRSPTTRDPVASARVSLSRHAAARVDEKPSDKTLKALCRPRQSVFDPSRRDTVLDLTDLIGGKIDAPEFFAENPITGGCTPCSSRGSAAWRVRDCLISKIKPLHDSGIRRPPPKAGVGGASIGSWPA
jgi:hypothetical protein